MGKWRSVKIGDFLFERKGKYKPTAAEIAGLQRIEKIDFSGNFYISNKPSKTDMILICSGDLVISGINVSKGALGVYQGNKAVTATIHYSSYSFDSQIINVEYFKRFLKSTLFIKLLKEQVKGGIKTEIKPKNLLPLEIKLPNLTEQEKILSRFLKIENQDKELKNQLNYQQTLIKKLRQQILQEAIEGELTAQWRKLNKRVEPASQLLEKIRAEKEKLIKAGKLKKQKPLPPIDANETPFPLPEGWAWCRLGDIAFINPRNQCSDETVAGFTPMPLVSPDFFVTPKYEKRDWIDIKKGYTHFAENDLVIAKITPCFENFKSGIIKNFPNGVGAGTTELHVIRNITPDIINIAYLYLFVKTTSFIENGRRLMTGAVGQKRVPKEYIESLIISLPPLEEQKAIVAKVEKLLSTCEQLQNQTKQNQESSNALMQSVLHESFTPT